MKTLLLVAIAGGIGSAARYAVTLGAHRYIGPGFPYGTLTVNVVGSFLLAAIMHLGARPELLAPDTRIILATGVLGGFTTYSAFNYETLDLLGTGNWKLAFTNMALTVLACLGAGLLGLLAARAVVS
jgi:CrcB protein